MASIERRVKSNGSENFRVRITLPGHPRLSATFTTRRKAERWAQRTESAMREGRYFPSAEAEQKTFGEVVERFIAEQLTGRSRVNRLIRQLRWWEEQLGSGTKLVQITAPRIVEVRDRLRRGHTPSGKPASPATINRYLALLSRVCAIAVKEWFWMDANPCANVSKAKEPRGRVRFLSDEERHRLLAACETSRDPRLYPLVLLAIATGARRGELLQLQWADVDLKRGLAVFHHTKNGERRSVPLTGPALAMMLRQAEEKGSTTYVFEGQGGSTEFPRKPWHCALAEAEITDFRFHDLRHTAASYLAMSGATLAEIAEVLGHKTLAMVKRYAHLTDAHTRTVVARMNEKFLAVA